jgi:hypothetical protein
MPADGSSLYLTIPAAADTGYDISLTGLTSSNLDIYLTDTNGFDSTTLNGGNAIANSLCSSANTGTLDELCVASTFAAGNLYLRIKNTDAVADAPYTLNIAASAPGTLGNPYPLTAAVVGTPSTVSSNTATTGDVHYVIPVNASRVYETALTGLTSNMNLKIYTDKNFLTSICYSSNFGNTDEYCKNAVTSPDITNLYIKIINYDDVAGAPYTLTVTENPVYSKTMSAPTAMGTVNPGGSSVTNNILTGIGGSDGFDAANSDVYLSYNVTPNIPYFIRVYDIKPSITGYIGLGVGTLSGGVFTPDCEQNQFTGSLDGDHDEVCMVVPASSTMVVAVNSLYGYLSEETIVSVEVTAGTSIITTQGTLFDFTAQTVLPPEFVNSSTLGWSVDTVTSGNSLPALVTGGASVLKNQSSCVGVAVDTTGWNASSTTFDVWTYSALDSDFITVYKNNVPVSQYSGYTSTWGSGTPIAFASSSIETLMWCYELDWTTPAAANAVRLDNILIQ